MIRLRKTSGKYRLSKSLRQEDLAEMADLSVNYIGMIKRGEKIPSLESFINIVNALDVLSDMILTDVLNQGYKVKNSLLNEKIEKLSNDDRDRIYDVIDAMLQHSKKKGHKIVNTRISASALFK